jgi:choline/glycine/proline betaine transport protein
MIESTGRYLQQLPDLSFQLFPFSTEGSDWMGSWTLFYWAWWISWSPFVGMFLARISRGRTIREFILGTLFAPIGVSIAWFTIFGGTALEQLVNNGSAALQNVGTNDAMFVLLETLALPDRLFTIVALLAITVVAIFFATSSDSGSLVVDMLTNGGDPNPVWQQRFVWAVLEGAIAAILLIAGATLGGEPLSALQTAAIAVGLPFSFVLVGMAWGLYRQLSQEPKPEETYTEETSITWISRWR